MKIVEKLTNEELMNNTDYTTQCFKGNSKEELIDELFREYCYNHKIKDKEKLKKDITEVIDTIMKSNGDILIDVSDILNDNIIE